MDWSEFAHHLVHQIGQSTVADAAGQPARLNGGQRDSLRVFAQHLPRNGMVLADEVGMGKTRIAAQLIDSVVRCGGRVAVLIPSGLGYQWQRELAGAGVESDHVLRGILGYMEGWRGGDAVAWADRQVVVLSHAFSNWQIREKSADPRRWILLPALVATLRLRNEHVSARACRNEVLQWTGGEAGLRAAGFIADTLERHPAAGQALLDFARDTQWARLLRSSEYSAGTTLRSMLLKAVGLGLGRFNLVIVDEAHKNRGKDTRLSVLLDEMLHVDERTRFVAMSATPVELDAMQWMQTLGRIRIPAAHIPAIEAAVKGYREALQRVRRSWRTSPEARIAYRQAAHQFQARLGDFVVRRDKREDADVRFFEEHGGRGYRDSSGEILVDTPSLPLAWRRAICAAESLSIVRRQGVGSDKRLRLTLASGHGTAKFLDEDDDEEAAIQKSIQDEQAEGLQTAEELEVPQPAPQGQQRAAWWRASLRASLREIEDAVYGHPALLAAVAAIDARTQVQQKVLVFGRYTRPMQALEQLLNAREMLRCMADGRYWPQRRLREDISGADQRRAVAAALRQWEEERGQKHPFALDAIGPELERRYQAERNARERFRYALVRRLGEAVGGMPFYGPLWRGLETASVRAQAGEDDSHPVALLAQSLQELTANRASDMGADELGREFIDLVNAVLDNDAAGRPQDTDIDPTATWDEFQQRLQVEYGTRTGGFARFMHGQTKLESRRILQQAFNRESAAPMVLIAQSLVGREGLNLHEACRVVVLLHPEWNPAVVEQQIGRVDRVGSRWARDMRAAVERGTPGNDLPRIEVLPVVFRDTYDEHNWRVLRDRWDDLRAQLHGEVIPPRLIGEGCTKEEQGLLAELALTAPNFSPGALWRSPPR